MILSTVQTVSDYAELQRYNEADYKRAGEIQCG